MVQNPPKDTPRVSPYLLYEDVDAAVEWLTKAFGFTETVRMPGQDGKTVHAELRHGGGLVMLGNPGPGYRNPRHLGGATQLVYIYVADVDAHYRQAVAAGAHILREPAEQFYGDRTYGAADPEGHQWSFAQHVRDVAAANTRP
ncbi:MAG TPA: VOC family protein [Streptosporangiaceae bacterium]|jgi:uncharacterized glyoxalase superfamily protein PhnB